MTYEELDEALTRSDKECANLREALERGRETLHKAIAERADMQATLANATTGSWEDRIRFVYDDWTRRGTDEPFLALCQRAVVRGDVVGKDK